MLRVFRNAPATVRFWRPTSADGYGGFYWSKWVFRFSPKGCKETEGFSFWHWLFYE